MLHDILKLEGIKKLNQTEKKNVNGGNLSTCNFTCLGGLCIMGLCYYVLK